MIDSVHPLTAIYSLAGDDQPVTGRAPGLRRPSPRRSSRGAEPAAARRRPDAPRWAALAQLAEEDLSLARLAEGHTDALAILAELGALNAPPAEAAGCLGRATARPGADGQQAARGWRLDGTKQYCSRPFGHRRAGHRQGAGRQPAVRGQHARSFPVPAPGPRRAWPPATRSTSTSPISRPNPLADQAAIPTGPVSHTVAQAWRCWYGGARGVGRAPRRRGRRDLGPHARLIWRRRHRAAHRADGLDAAAAESTRIRTTGRRAAGRVPSGARAGRGHGHRGHAAGGPSARSWAAEPRRGARAPGRGPHGVHPAASRRARSG